MSGKAKYFFEEMLTMTRVFGPLVRGIVDTSLATVRTACYFLEKKMKRVDPDWLTVPKTYWMPLVIDPVDGSKILADKGMELEISPDLKNKVNEPGQPTGETHVDAREQVRRGTFQQLFGSLNTDVGRLCLSQHQIRNFAEKYRLFIKLEFSDAIFLFKSNSLLLVAQVRFISGTYEVPDTPISRVTRLSDPRVWSADGHYHTCVVIPQQVV